MKLWSQYFIPTLKESPADAEIPSHKLLIRAGLVRKLGGGLYTYLPLGLRVMQRLSQVCREELERAGIIFRRQGLGTFVAEQGRDRSRETTLATAKKLFRDGCREAAQAGLNTGQTIDIVREILNENQ